MLAALESCISFDQLFAPQSWSARVVVRSYSVDTDGKNLKELDIWYHYEILWISLILIDFGLCSLFFWPRRGCYMASSREYDSKSVPELHDNQDESSDCNFKWLQVPCLRKVSWPIQFFRARHFTRNKGWLLPWCLSAIMLQTGLI